MVHRVCVLAFLFCLPAAAQEEKPAAKPAQEKVSAEQHAFPFEGEVACERLNVRLAPKSDPGTIIATVLGQGSKVTVMGETGDFFHILPPKGCHVWIWARNVKRDSDTEGTVLVNDAAVRLDSRGNADKLAGLKEGEKIQIVKEHLGWFQIQAPDSVKYFVGRKYVKYVGVANVAPRAPAREPTGDARALALIKEAEKLVDEQHKLIEAKAIRDVSFTRVVELYTEAAAAATSDDLRKSAESSANRYRTLGISIANTIIGLEKKEQELAAARAAQVKKDEAPKYDFMGYVDTVGPLWNRPGTHKLMMAGKIVCFLKVKDGDEPMRLKLNRLYECYAGVKGVVTKNPEGWPGYSVVEVESITELGK
jgi:uncharacterized protein YgiM (DUF1202 family)